MVFCHAYKSLLKKNSAFYGFIRIRELCTSQDHVKVQDHAKVLVSLKSRKLLKIYGEDSSEFLQGLVTNDMRHFEDGAKSMFAMFLNNKGRVLYDTLIHRWEGKDSFIVECDRSNFSSLLKHLSIFKLKRKVKIEDMNREYHLWALLSAANLVPDAELDPKSPINIYKDPRLPELGCRILTALPLQGSQIVEMLGHNVELKDEDLYKYWRYKLGVGEGPEDLPPGACFPLEANCDYLHGVSFYKGCYIGQELTARIYHTGVIRKRLMPIRFFNEVQDFIEKDFPITAANNPKKKLGKLKNFRQDRGLGLVNVKEALEMQTLRVGDNSAEIIKPSWWPVEAPKDKIKMEDVKKIQT